MDIKSMGYFDEFQAFCEAMSLNGAFLLVGNKEGKRNIMTIGWASIGVMWSEPVMTVMVRPSRYTHKFMEEAEFFSVNVPVNKFKKELAYCGSRSGRDEDKETATGLKVAGGLVKGVSVIEGCDLYYECGMIHKNEVRQEFLETSKNEKFYTSGDHHTMYYGKILKAYKKA